MTAQPEAIEPTQPEATEADPIAEAQREREAVFAFVMTKQRYIVERTEHIGCVASEGEDPNYNLALRAFTLQSRVLMDHLKTELMRNPPPKPKTEDDEEDEPIGQVIRPTMDEWERDDFPKVPGIACPVPRGYEHLANTKGRRILTPEEEEELRLQGKYDYYSNG